MNIFEIKRHAEDNVVQSAQATEKKDFKTVFTIARPILVFLSNFFLIPNKVRVIISHLIEILDTLTPIFANDVSNIQEPTGLM